MKSQYKNTRGKVCSIFSSLVWYATKNEKKKKKGKHPNLEEKKTILSALAGIKHKPQTTVIDLLSKCLANTIYDKLINNEDTHPTVYKTSWILDTVASGHYADDETIVKDKGKIQPGTGINVGCADKGVLSQTGKGKLLLDNVPEATKEVRLFHDIHSPLLSGGEFVVGGKCTLVFGRKNAHIVKGRTGELVKEIMKQAEDNSDDIVITVSFDEETLIWRTNSNRQAKPLFNITSNVH